MQFSNDMADTLSHKTAVTTSFSKERGRLPETGGAKSCQQSNQVGLYFVGIHQMASPEHTSAWSGQYPHVTNFSGLLAWEVGAAQRSGCGQTRPTVLAGDKERCLPDTYREYVLLGVQTEV